MMRSSLLFVYAGTYRMVVEHGKRYLLRVVNAAMNEELFLSLSRHRLTVVGADGSYTKPFTTNYVMITPGQTMDLLLEANQSPHRRYYMAVTAYSSSTTVAFDNTTATAILQYASSNPHKSLSKPLFPSSLPANNDTGAATTFAAGLRSLASAEHPADVPQAVDDHLVITTSINELPCATGSCEGPNGTRLAASLNNISFVTPSVDVLGAYYRRIAGVFESGFPKRPPLRFDFTAEDLPLSLLLPRLGTKVKVLPYNRSVEVVFQGTNLVAALNHPMHLHGHSFYVVGKGFGNFHRKRDARRYNLVDPPMVNTVGVPRKGWVAVRFRTMNPGVWFLHCHLERHLSWGMDTVLIVKNGKSHGARMLPPPPDMPPSYSSSTTVAFDNTTATAILQYASSNPHKCLSKPLFPSSLPANNDTGAATTFAAGLRSLASAEHPADVPQAVDDHLIITTSINELPCATGSCEGPNGTRLAASLNNISFVTPSVDVLGAYYRRIAGVFESSFPKRPPLRFDFTAEDLPLSLLLPRLGTKVKVLPYNRSVEVVFQGTNLVAALNHPMHLHGHSFYVVGKGFGNFHRKRDARRYNLVDPPMVNTVGVPPKGWVAVRFRTMNPGVWFLHCHLERHLSWGMDTVLIVKNGKSHGARMLPPPPDMPPCMGAEANGCNLSGSCLERRLD
ncbi:hypothetical protein Taro_014675 [Colocasia esculenta]|uniref:laccase n=1 Tax=Colocasia esculenta TaxID=4460 RepID=A0A843UF91_COLES|nr:hypothetical protein [Colocasia esculenta]